MKRRDSKLTKLTKVPSNVTILDVAKAAGVSYSTVSRVATNSSRISSETRQRVLAAMEQLGYVANPLARSLAGGKSQIVGLLVHGLNSEYIGEVTRGIEEELYQAGYDLMLYTTRRRKGKEAEYVSMLSRGLADGLLLVVPMGREAYLDALQASNFPYVLVDDDMDNDRSPWVGTTNRQGAYDATCYLLGLGHRRIAFITDMMAVNTAVARMKGYRAALESAGVAYDPALVQELDFMNPDTRAAVEKLLVLADRPTAILTSGDPIAFRAMDLLRDHKLKIPEDMSIIGYDDVSHASLVNPRLTSVHAPLFEMGKVAARMLLKRIQYANLPPRHIQLETQLVVRESCGPPHGR